MSLFENNKELQFGTHSLMMSRVQAQRSWKGEERSFTDLGGALVNKESIGGEQKVEVQRLLIGWVRPPPIG